MYDKRRRIALADTTDVSNRRSTPTRLPNENGFDVDIACALVKGVKGIRKPLSTFGSCARWICGSPL
jgi:hypothetical protein